MRVSRKDFSQDRDRFRAEATAKVRSFAGQKVHNASTSTEINITSKGIRHTLHNAGDGLLMVTTKLPEILRMARLVSTKPDRRERRNVRAVHHFESNLTIDQKQHMTHVTVVEDNQGNQFYDLALIRKKGRGIRVKGDSPDQHQNPIPEPFDGNVDQNAGREKGQDKRARENKPNQHRKFDTRPFDEKIDGGPEKSKVITDATGPGLKGHGLTFSVKGIMFRA